MNNEGFRLKSFVLTGPNVPAAEVTFEKGLNVIVGPSDTGKTFIAQCIDFMLGASKPPKSIPESQGYDTATLSIQFINGSTQYVLERSLRGGDFRLRSDDGEEQVLGAKHAADRTDTVSYFLLDACSMAGKRIRTNQQGTTRPLSFRDLAKLVLVDETSVITELSPIHSGQVISRTAEQNVFRFLLTGVDDSSIVEKVDPKVSRGRIEGKTEVLDKLLKSVRERLSALGQDDLVETRLQFERIQITNRDSSLMLTEEQQSIAGLERQRNAVWTEIRRIESRVALLSELQERFELLLLQYGSDLRRLDSIAETGLRLGQMDEERCPVCGAVAEHHDASHTSPYATPEEIGVASRVEAIKIRALLDDLAKSMTDNTDELTLLEGQKRSRLDSLTLINNEITNRSKPRLQDALKQFNDTHAIRESLLRALELHSQVDELNRLIVSIETVSGKSTANGLKGPIGTDEAEIFSQEVEKLLRRWKFPNLDRVTFSEEDQDVVITGRKRATHGKGVRAITHSAFNLALLRYCIRQSRPHPRFVLIDSPLVVYREPDVGEDGFTNDVKDAFYRSLAEDFTESQVIILENDPPPDTLDGTANIVRFTGSDQGRGGFIPKPQGSSV